MGNTTPNSINSLSQTSNGTTQSRPNSAPNGEVKKRTGFFSEMLGLQPEVGEDVILHVYSFPSEDNNYLSFAEKMGFGAHHSGIEVFGTEYAFEGGYDEECGLYKQKPKTIPSYAEWTYYQSVHIGKTSKTEEQIKEILAKFAPDWKRKDYHIIGKNCNHFTDLFAKELLNGRGIPGWVNRLANSAVAIATLSGPLPSQEEIMNMAFLQAPIPRNLNDFIDDELVDVFNESEWHPLDFVLFEKREKATFRSGDEGPQLLLVLPFVQPVQLNEILIEGRPNTAPKHIKIYHDLKNPTFDSLSKIQPHHEVILTAHDPPAIVLPQPEFGKIKSLVIYIMDNQEGSAVTFITNLDFFGMPV